MLYHSMSQYGISQNSMLCQVRLCYLILCCREAFGGPAESLLDEAAATATATATATTTNNNNNDNDNDTSTNSNDNSNNNSNGNNHIAL